MIFSLIDYRAYRRRAGRFARDIGKTIMGGAFEGGLPPNAVNALEPADTLLIQSLDSRIAWLIMYLTSSEISHVAAYIGNGEIVHATLSGTCIEPIDALFDPSTRILPTKWDWGEIERNAYVAASREYLGRPYGWLPVAVKAALILSGRDWGYFRWHFFIDIAAVLLVLDIPIYLFLHHPLFSFLIPAYLSLIFANWALWKIKPLKFSEWTGKPCDMLTIVQNSGGSVMFDAYHLAQQLRKDQGAPPKPEVDQPL